MKTLAAFALLAAFAAGAPAFAQAPAPPASPTGLAEKTVDALKLFPMLEKFYAIPSADRSKLALGYAILNERKPSPDVHLTLVVGERRTPLALAPDGKLMRLPTSADLAAHAQVTVSAPHGAKLSSRLDLGSSIAPAQEISAADCTLAIAQANAAIRRVAGMVMSFMAPHISRAAFPGAGSGVAVAADGKTTPLPVVKGVPVYDPNAIKGAKTLRFTHAPSHVDFD